MNVEYGSCVILPILDITKMYFQVQKAHHLAE